MYFAKIICATSIAMLSMNATAQNFTRDDIEFEASLRVIKHYCSDSNSGEDPLRFSKMHVASLQSAKKTREIEDQITHVGDRITPPTRAECPKLLAQIKKLEDSRNEVLNKTDQLREKFKGGK